MEIAALQIPNLIGSFIQTLKVGGVIELQPGSIVPAIILEIDENSYANVQIFGQTIRAKIDADLQEGDGANLYVTGNIKNGAMELKIVNTASNTIPNTVLNTGNKKPPIDIDGIIKAIGAPVTKEVKTLVAELLSQNIPVTAQAIKASALVLQEPPAVRPLIPVLVNMIQLGIPIDSETVQIMQHLENGPEFQASLRNLLQSVRLIPKEGGTEALPPSLQNGLQKAEQVITQLLTENLAGPELKTKVSLLGLDYEQKAGELIRLIILGNGTVAKDELKNWLQDAGSVNLKQVLLELDGKTIGLKNAGLEKLAEAVTAVLHHVTAQQLITQAVQENYGMIYRFFSLPVQTEGYRDTLQFQVMSRKGAGNKKIDPWNCYILICLNLPHLGGLDIHMNVIDKAASIRFVAENAVGFAGLDQQELRQVISGVGYRLNAFSVEEKKSEKEHKTVLPPVISQLDLKV